MMLACDDGDVNGIRCMMLRGGTSKGLYFLSADVPSDPAERASLMLRLMGTPDPRQIDGLGGAHPLTSKVAVVGPSTVPGVDVDYLFLQVGVDGATVSDRQECGNLLAGVGPFAVERGLVRATADAASVRIRMVNTGAVSTATFPTRDGQPVYEGTTSISGVPGTAAAVDIRFHEVAGASCGALLPTGSAVDEIDGVAVTMIDNGMPVLVVLAADLGISGYESCADLEDNEPLRARVEQLRVVAGERMGLGDVRDTTVPKVSIVAPPAADGDICTRTFIPHRCHEAIGALGAVSVATAAMLPGSPAAAALRDGADPRALLVEHPTGTLGVSLDVVEGGPGAVIDVRSAGIVRTTRKLFDGEVFPRPELGTDVAGPY